MKKTEEYDYLDLTTDQINIGDMFFVEVENIVSVSLQPLEISHSGKFTYYPHLHRAYDANKFQRTFYKEDEFIKLDNMYKKERRFDDFSAQDIKWDSITLLEYIGNNEFLEYYTNGIIRYENSPQFVDFASIRRKRISINKVEPEKDYITFMEKYNLYLINPLYVENGTLLPTNNKYIQKFFKQGKHQIKLKKIINKMREEAVYYLEEDFNSIKQQDEEFANEENVIRTLKKSAFDTALEGSKIFLEAQGFINEK